MNNNKRLFIDLAAPPRLRVRNSSNHQLLSICAVWYFSCLRVQRECNIWNNDKNAFCANIASAIIIAAFRSFDDCNYILLSWWWFILLLGDCKCKYIQFCCKKLAAYLSLVMLPILHTHTHGGRVKITKWAHIYMMITLATTIKQHSKHLKYDKENI